jgi:hypothetical protein
MASPAQVIAPKRQPSQGGAAGEGRNEADDDTEDECGEPRPDPSKRLAVPSASSDSASKRPRTM